MLLLQGKTDQGYRKEKIEAMPLMGGEKFMVSSLQFTVNGNIFIHYIVSIVFSRSQFHSISKNSPQTSGIESPVRISIAFAKRGEVY
jgi:hypothetical protein